MITINTKEELVETLKEFKEEGLKKGLIVYALYPSFTKFLQDNKDKIQVNLPNGIVYDTALDVFLDLGDDEE